MAESERIRELKAKLVDAQLAQNRAWLEYLALHDRVEFINTNLVHQPDLAFELGEKTPRMQEASAALKALQRATSDLRAEVARMHEREQELERRAARQAATN